MTDLKDERLVERFRRDPTQFIVVATVVLCCVAPLLTSLSRSGKAPPEAYVIFQRLFFFNDYVGSLAMLAALVLALALPKVQEAVCRLAAWVGERPGPIIWGSFVVLALCSRFVYLAHPFSMDEYTPWMQANAFARGELTVHYPVELLDAIVPRQFQSFFFATDRRAGELASNYWPGLALLLVPFVWLDIGWCLNPALGALSLVLIHRLASDAAGDRAAGGWALLASLASPQFTVSAISFYAMTGELALNLLFLWLLLRPDLKSAFAAGLVGGLALAMHNPMPHALMAAPCLVWLAMDRKRWARLAAALVGYVPLVVALGAGWWAVRTGLVASGAGVSGGGSTGTLDALSTGLSILSRVVMFPTEDMLVARWYASWKVWIWGCPGLLLLLLVPRERGTVERLLIAGFLTTFVFFLFIPFDQGHGWGYRYIHTAWAALPVVAGLWLANASVAARRWGAATVMAGLLATPVFLWQTQATIKDALSYRLEPQGAGDWVIFIAQDTGRYRGDLVQNAPGQDSLLHLVSEGETKDRALMARHFPQGAQVQSDQRGSSWRLPPGALAAYLARGAR